MKENSKIGNVRSCDIVKGNNVIFVKDDGSICSDKIESVDVVAGKRILTLVHDKSVKVEESEIIDVSVAAKVREETDKILSGLRRK